MDKMYSTVDHIVDVKEYPTKNAVYVIGVQIAI